MIISKKKFEQEIEKAREEERKKSEYERNFDEIFTRITRLEQIIKENSNSCTN